MTERDPIFREAKERLDNLGIKGVLFDLDDTLIFTSEIFSQCMQEYADLVAKRMGLEKTLVLEVLRAINDEEYKKMGVNPRRWRAVVEKLAERFSGFEGVIIENLDILLKIYSIEPRIRRGARAVLEIFRGSGVKMGLVTHANVEWTYFKLNNLGLWDYFDQVVIVDENGHKKADDWRRGMDALELFPEKCLVVGDSLSGDIRPGDELGARTVWLPSPWSVYRQGEVPEKTVQIDEIFGLLAALRCLR